MIVVLFLLSGDGVGLNVFPGLQLELTAEEYTRAGAAAIEEDQNSWMKIINKKDDRAMRCENSGVPS